MSDKKENAMLMFCVACERDLPVREIAHHMQAKDSHASIALCWHCCLQAAQATKIIVLRGAVTDWYDVLKEHMSKHPEMRPFNKTLLEAVKDDMLEHVALGKLTGDLYLKQHRATIELLSDRCMEEGKEAGKIFKTILVRNLQGALR